MAPKKNRIIIINMNPMKTKRLLRNPCKIEILDMRGTISLGKKTSDTSLEIRIGNKADRTTIVEQFERTCRGAVGEDYGTQSLEKAHYIIVAKTKSQRVCGFVSLTLHYPKISKELYIDLICAPGGNPRVSGSLLLKHVERLATYLKCSRIKLSSLDDPFCFYASRGFKECDDACDVGMEGECAPNAMKLPYGDSDKGWRMTKCTEPAQLKITNTQIQKEIYNIPRKCKVSRTKPFIGSPDAKTTSKERKMLLI
jgi:hypothetical protein